MLVGLLSPTGTGRARQTSTHIHRHTSASAGFVDVARSLAWAVADTRSTSPGRRSDRGGQRSVRPLGPPGRHARGPVVTVGRPLAIAKPGVPYPLECVLRAGRCSSKRVKTPVESRTRYLRYVSTWHCAQYGHQRRLMATHDATLAPYEPPHHTYRAGECMIAITGSGRPSVVYGWSF